jgi:hypothetical protein
LFFTVVLNYPAISVKFSFPAFFVSRQKFNFLAKSSLTFPPKAWVSHQKFDFSAITVSRQNLLQAPPTKSREGEEGGGDRIPQPLPKDAGRESQEARGGQFIPINMPKTFNN